MPTFTNKTVGPDNAIEGAAVDGRGITGTSETNYGVRAHSKKSAGLRGSSDEGRGVEGWGVNSEGVVGISTSGNAVWGQTEGGGAGVVGTSKDGIGVYGESTNNEGVRGTSHNAHGGVVGVNTWIPVDQPPGTGGNGGWFESEQGEGLRGTAKNPNHGGVVGVNDFGGVAIFGTSKTSVGVWGTSETSEGVHAETKSTTTAALAAYQNNEASPSAALYAKHAGSGGMAAILDGNVLITGHLQNDGDITCTNADCAEDFDISGTYHIEPGTVMVLGDEGTLLESHQAYDKRVAGVISGAGSYKPGIVLDKQQSAGNRQPIALMGKVFCKVDATFGAIEVGDLLTTSATPGHAMKAGEPLQAFGAVIGKALRPLKEGQGLIPILIALQ